MSTENTVKKIVEILPVEDFIKRCRSRSFITYDDSYLKYEHCKVITWNEEECSEVFAITDEGEQFLGAFI